MKSRHYLTCVSPSHISKTQGHALAVAPTDLRVNSPREGDHTQTTLTVSSVLAFYGRKLLYVNGIQPTLPPEFS
jgi:hypothetical protein